MVGISHSDDITGTVDLARIGYLGSGLMNAAGNLVVDGYAMSSFNRAPC